MLLLNPRFFLSLALVVIWHNRISAQTPLPNFEVKDIGSGRIVISWINPYPYTAQITIQRSLDSLGIYKSIISVPDPTAVQNGFADTKAMNDHMFYRLYILLDKGNYFFTTAQKPQKPVASPPSPVLPSAPPVPTPVAAEQPYTTPPLPFDSGAQKISPPVQVSRVDPAVIKRLLAHSVDSVKTPYKVIPQKDPDVYGRSLYVYTQPNGNIRIEVPNKKRLSSYRIRFYEADKQFLFELNQLPAPGFQVDKANFLHSGWFLFELYEETRLIEQRRIFLGQDF